MNIIKKENYKVPVFNWCLDIEESATEQIDNLAQLPFVFSHIAIMSDCHAGYGMPIGGVLATQNVIIPNAVGVDIGCGMQAIKTSLQVEEISENLKAVLGDIRKLIPVGFEHHKQNQLQDFMPNQEFSKGSIIEKEYSSALKQIGTLGGGNHFIEIQKDEENFVWVMIHSGSRNLGKKVADHYNKIAIELNEKWFSNIDNKWQLNFLPVDSEKGRAYISEMQYCVAFAECNRKLMMKRIKEVLFEYYPNVVWTSCIDVAHNYARIENHFGKDLMVHRKGAISARRNEIGIIPGSQGSVSYITEGLGNEKSFNSSSHGAGRRMSRNEARRTLSVADEANKLNEQGIIHNIRTQKDLDEAPSAYKDIDQVMKAQKDLTAIINRLIPLAVIKG